MTALTISEFDDDLHERLSRRALTHGVTPEQEARAIRVHALADAQSGRRKPSIEELAKFSVKPTEPFDLKALSDEMWDESLR